MARGITEDQVHTAADALVANGERPTVERVRAHLGTGSPNTVVRWLETWWKTLGVRLQEHTARMDIPKAPEAVAELAGRWWAVALEHAKTTAERSLALEWTALNEALADLEQRREGFTQEAAALRQRCDEAIGARDLANVRADELGRLIDQLQAQVRELARHRDTAIASTSEAEAERREVEGRLQALQEEFASERDDLTKYVRSLENRAHAEVDASRQEIRDLKRQVAALSRQHAATELASRSELEELRVKAESAVRDAAVQRAKVEALEAQLVHLRDLPKTLKSALREAGPTSKPRKATARKSASAKKSAR